MGAIAGWRSTAPVRALLLWEMAQFLEKIGYAWTPAEYWSQRAGDIAWLREYWQMTAPAEVERVEKVDGG